MSFDIMEMVKGAVSKQVMGKLGGLLGTDEAKTSSVFDSAAGSILGGLIKKAGSSEGQKAVFEATQNQDPSVLDKLGDLLGGGQATEQYESAGGGILDMVFGSGQSGILGTLGKALGLEGGIVGKLMKLVAPIVMAVIAKHVKSKALDMVGLGDLFGQQKNTLGKYVPASLTENLGLSAMAGNVSSAVGSAADKVGSIGKDATDSVGAVAKKSGGIFGKVLIGLLALGALGLYYYLNVYLPNSQKPTKIPPADLRVLVSEDGGEEVDTHLPKIADKYGFDGKEMREKLLAAKGRTVTLDNNVVIRVHPSVPTPMSMGASIGQRSNDGPKDPNAPKKTREDAEVDLSTLGELGRTLKQGAEDITDGFANMKDLDGAKSLAETATFFGDEVDELDFKSGWASEGSRSHVRHSICRHHKNIAQRGYRFCDVRCVEACIRRLV